MLKINIDAVSQIIREVADEEIMPRFRNLDSGDVTYKIGDDPVTIADKRAESALSKRLLPLLEGSKLVGEEAFFENQGLLSLLKGDSPVWIVDPIDGTRAFVAQNPVFGVLVALSQRNETLAGWLYDPNSREMITVEKGSGAWLGAQRLAVQAPVPVAEMAGTVGTELTQLYAKLNPPPLKDQPAFEDMGCSCHEYARLIAGTRPHFSRPGGKPWSFRATLTFCTPWDDQAGLLAFKEAGGFSRHWNGEKVTSSSLHHGILSTPDEDSWHALKDWTGGFCETLGAGDVFKHEGLR